MRRAAIFALLLGGACDPTGPATPSGGFPIGAVLPFTGDLGAVGTNLEQALRFGGEAVNQAGGVAGLPVRLAVRDDHSDISRGLSVTQDLISNERVVGIIGPEGENLAKLMVPIAEMNDTILISPGVTSEITTTVVPKDLWFKVVPSAARLSRELAQRMWREGVRSVSIIYTADEYGTGFASFVVTEWKAAGATIATLVPVQPGQRSFSDDVRKAVEARPDGLVLVSAPRTGAAIVHEWSIARAMGRWFFAPPLKTDLFVQNVPPGILDGMFGVAAKVGGDAAGFAQAFAQRWRGDQPVTSAYFYYDALMLLALASEAAAVRAGRVPTALEVRDQLRAVANQPGEVVRWNEVALGLGHLRAGRDINYQGVSGDVELGVKGEVAGGEIQFWTIAGERIVDE